MILSFDEEIKIPQDKLITTYKNVCVRERLLKRE
jgi:hypothetical protein